MAFDEKKKHEYEWSKIDLSKEIYENNEFILGNLMNRSSLLITEITGSYGQTPLIIPHRLFTDISK